MIPYEKKEHYTIDDLAEIVTLLRSKDGCPWDKVQTHESIRPDLIEETYEVIEAIDQNDPEMLREELGDLLLQVVFHSRIETEQGHFTLDDVCTDICNKLIIRHPHVFSTVQADTTEEVLKNWDTIKEETKHQTTRTQTLEAVAKTLPALMRAQKVCKRALKGNNRFLCNESVLASVTECKHTLEEAMHMEDAEQITRAMGELLFCCAGMAQTLGLSAEQVLTDTANQLREAGAHVHSFSRGTTHTDVGNLDDVVKALSEVAQKEGRIDFVVNTAGILNKEPLCTMEYETIQKAVTTNYMGTVNVAISAYPYLKETHGKLVLFTSSSYTRGRAFYSIYSSTKAAIVNFVQAVAQEWEPAGIAVNCINPERTKTPMRVQNFGVEPDDTLLRSEDVAAATVRSLLSDYTGQVIDVKRKNKQ